MAQSTNVLTGDKMTRPDEAVAITLERYDELIKKEALLDKLMEGKDVNVYLFQKVEEELKNAEPSNDNGEIDERPRD